jgi:hypothetical protein
MTGLAGGLLAVGLTALLAWPTYTSARPMSIERVSVGDHGAQGNEEAGLDEEPVAVVSANGRFVAFWSFASNIAGGTRGIFVRDRRRGTTRLAHAGGLTPLSISDDGRFVLFVDYTTFSDGDPIDPDGPWNTDGPDLSLRDLQLGITTVLASGEHPGLDPPNWKEPAVLSGDGRSVAFLSPRDVGADEYRYDVAVRDLPTGTTTRLTSHPASYDNSDLRISTDGRVVGFQSGRSFKRYVVHDRATGATLDLDRRRRVLLAADGSTIAFNSASPNRVPGDTNGRTDVFVQNLRSLGVHRVSVDTGGRERMASSYVCDVSADGRVTAFYSWVAVAGAERALFVHDRTRARTRRIYPQNGKGFYDFFGCSLSSDGRWLAFSSTASDLVRGDTNGVADVFVAGPLIR